MVTCLFQLLFSVHIFFFMLHTFNEIPQIKNETTGFQIFFKGAEFRYAQVPLHSQIIRVHSTPMDSNVTVFLGLYCPTPILLNPLWSWC